MLNQSPAEQRWNQLKQHVNATAMADLGILGRLYRYQCSCGAKGPWKHTRIDAAHDHLAHQLASR